MLSDTINSTSSSSNNMKTTNPRISYSNIVRIKLVPINKFDFPTEEQGIIFPLIKNSSLKHYLIAVN